MEHRRVCFRMLSLLPLVQISKLSQANSLLFGKVCCRTPRGVRGLKSLVSRSELSRRWSHPSRGAWIEIVGYGTGRGRGYGRTPRGVRGLKFQFTHCDIIKSTRRTPRGGRGLKYF